MLLEVLGGKAKGRTTMRLKLDKAAIDEVVRHELLQWNSRHHLSQGEQHELFVLMHGLLTRELAGVKADLAKAEEAIRSVEWIRLSGNINSFCPACGASKDMGHWPQCPIAFALAPKPATTTKEGAL